MSPLRAYLGTSVLGGAFGEEFSEDMQALLNAIEEGSVIPVMSDVVRTELALAPHEVRSRRGKLEVRGAEVLDLNVEADRTATWLTFLYLLRMSFRTLLNGVQLSEWG